MLRFRHNRNENVGLSFYNSDFQVLSGFPPLVSDIMSNPQFKVVTTALWSMLLADSELTKMQIASATAQLSYTSDFVRDYMSTSIIEDKSFLLPELDNFWVPLFQRKGYDAIIVRRLFIHFNELFKKGVVTRDIWKPSPKTVQTEKNKRDSSGTSATTGGSKTWLYLGIGAGVIVLGSAFFLMRKE